MEDGQIRTRIPLRFSDEIYRGFSELTWSGRSTGRCAKLRRRLKQSDRKDARYDNKMDGEESELAS